MFKMKYIYVLDFSIVCSRESCGNVVHYDGQEDCVLNMGRFLVHHEVLRDYMHHFLFSR